MKRKQKKFSWPRKLFDKIRITEENKLVEKYGLKNKKEIWKTEAKIKVFRTRAKSLLSSEEAEQKKFFNKLNLLGLKIETITGVLALNVEDLLKRRLSSMLVTNKVCNTAKEARQMVVHRNILVDGRVINIPSYLVNVDEEKKLKKKLKKGKKALILKKTESSDKLDNVNKIELEVK